MKKMLKTRVFSDGQTLVKDQELNEKQLKRYGHLMTQGEDWDEVKTKKEEKE